jgi:GNAT superfamily N-acetyltransferase
MFAKYHYLSHSHNNAARVFLAFVNGQLAGFLSVLHFPHPKAKNIKKIHRLVILPDYQGASFGLKFLNAIAAHLKAQKQRVTITTSSPSLVFGLKMQSVWKCKGYGRKKAGDLSKSTITGHSTIYSENRVTTDWEYVADADNKT